MRGIRSMVLGATPIRTVSSRPTRRRLYATPTPAPASVATTAQKATLTTRPGTMVKHINIAAHPRSGKLGVITTTETTRNMLIVLWTDDGSTESVQPNRLTIADFGTTQAEATTAPETPTATMTTPTRPGVATASTTNPSFFPAHIQKGYRPLLPSKLPDGLVCPLDSIDQRQIEIYQLQMDIMKEKYSRYMLHKFR